jgi:glycosyltransferase involved in cell wall biosynthesis
MNRLRITVIVSSLGFGGAEKQTIALANLLPEGEFDVSLVYLERRSDLLADLRAGIRSKTFCLDKRSSADVGLLWRLRRALLDLQPDVVLCVNTYPLILFDVLAFTLPRKPKLVTVLHSTIMESGFHEQSVRHWAGRALECRCDSVIFISHAQLAYWREHYGIGDQTGVVIWNGVDTAHYSPRLSEKERIVQRVDLGFGADEFVIACCAAMRPEKCHRDLLKAAEMLIRRGHRVKLLLIGDGPERLGLEQWISDHDMKRHCVITGFQSDVRTFLEAADVVVLSSRTEGFPLAVLEAMSIGKPVVAPAVGGIPEQIESGITGYTYKVGHVSALAEALEKIIQEECAEAMGTAARQSACTLFDEGRMVSEYASLLRAVCVNA